MQLRVHNTLTRTKEVFEPADEKRVRMYVCGPTVYQRIHVGNARAFVVFDVLYRLLRHLYGADNVVYVRNITDIDDKIMDQARKNGETIRALTDRTTADFQADLAALGCLPPTHEPRATEHVPGMIAMIGTLIERGHAYAADGHVLFNVPSMPTYGRLSRRDRDEQIAGARVDVAPYKRDPADFVLWKPSTDDQDGWDSPWGRGRPGWHIECSAMSEHFLGPLPFDLHAGGLDLIFPHHENEIAQSCCAHGIDTMARYWMHNGFLDMRGEKMSKSLGNVVRVPEALGIASGEALRLLLLQKHYRQAANYSPEQLQQAEWKLTKFYDTIKRYWNGQECQPDEVVVRAIADDINSPRAITRLDAIRATVERSENNSLAATLRASGQFLGILTMDPNEWLHRSIPNNLQMPSAQMAIHAMDPSIISGITAEKIAEAIAVRAELRASRRFGDADKVRGELMKQGVVLEDRPDGTTDWRRA